MNTTDEPKPGWILLVGPRSLNATMLAVIARLGEGGPLNILDGGNLFNAYTVARAARGRSEVLDRITVARAFTCYQVLSLLEGTSPQVPPASLVILDLLATFYDESVQAGERKRLLCACLAHLRRLDQAAGGPRESAHPDSRLVPAGVSYYAIAELVTPLTRLAVSVHPPKVPSQAALDLLQMLQQAAGETYFIQQPEAAAPEPLRLF